MAGVPPRPDFFDACAARQLTWWPELGIGFYPVEAGIEPYDAAYFERFQQQADTLIGRALMQARVDFVSGHYQGGLVDVGIGSGAFIERRNSVASETTFGFDVNPVAEAWLRQRGLFIDPYRERVPAVSLWDVMEHIPDFRALLARVSEWVFVSIPIFRDGQHVLCSKHFRKDEHVWYFTSDGLIRAFDDCGFDVVSSNRMETDCGREDIGTFAFRRRGEGRSRASRCTRGLART
ncbi:hypothetical protein ASD12_18090 [Mesorhizobium sp. Root102]|uniref:methyltransferase domain-containing protein n=1 Tax=Mesorhizobium sp. Root102 TaxID=1736422 RepID=UPI00070147F8|nr:methyltransferase domain-containing protein [Mesorhizobium sp. Root102]KQU77711.1 hypothetical protein ASD12_18090 [Mesorhizobium sp. Root102]